jgi:hypothetical protein
MNTLKYLDVWFWLWLVITLALIGLSLWFPIF